MKTQITKNYQLQKRLFFP